MELEPVSEEHGKLTVYDVDRLGHALEANTRWDLPVMEEKTKNIIQGGVVVSKEVTEVQTGYLPHRMLEKLKAKVIYSLRGELEMIGELELADHIIFQDSDKMQDENCEGK